MPEESPTPTLTDFESRARTAPPARCGQLSGHSAAPALQSRPQPTGPRHIGPDTQPDLHKIANLAALDLDPAYRPTNTRDLSRGR
jgi:hypothetical protein